jgi:hypothetical protein
LSLWQEKWEKYYGKERFFFAFLFLLKDLEGRRKRCNFASIMMNGGDDG